MEHPSLTGSDIIKQSYSQSELTEWISNILYQILILALSLKIILLQSIELIVSPSQPQEEIIFYHFQEFYFSLPVSMVCIAV